VLFFSYKEYPVGLYSDYSDFKDAGLALESLDRLRLDFLSDEEYQKLKANSWYFIRTYVGPHHKILWERVDEGLSKRVIS
jgi:hypothetical protein